MHQNQRFTLAPEWPHWGRDTMDHGHAIFCIARQLSLLDLRDWTPTIVHWLGMYDGLEMHLPPEDDPFGAVLKVLVDFVVNVRNVSTTTLQRTQRKAAIVNDLLDQQFIFWRANWSDRRTKIPREWHPLKQSWMAFIESGETAEELWFHKTESWPNPCLHDLQRFLLTPPCPGFVGS